MDKNDPRRGAGGGAHWQYQPVLGWWAGRDALPNIAVTVFQQLTAATGRHPKRGEGCTSAASNRVGTFLIHGQSTRRQPCEPPPKAW